MENEPSLLNTNGQSRGDVVSGFQTGQKLLSRYRLERVLGQGGMGVVWLARDEELERDVALKFLPEMVINDRASLNDLKKETRRSLELTHPNIVRTYDFVQDSSVAGISMEYVDSDTLRNLRIDQPDGVFQCGQIGEWTRQLCLALDYAHGQASIVHRDLKPANLMVNRKNQLKVTDFGISRSLVESVTQMTMNVGISGTLVYMSPQQLSGETASPLDDVYAIGATLFELLTTRPPFYAGDITGQIHNKTPPTLAERRASLAIPVGEIPQNWEKTVAACLAKDPSHRPRTAGEIAVRLGIADASTITMRNLIMRPPGDPAARLGGPASFAGGPATGGHPVVSGFTTSGNLPPPLPTATSPTAKKKLLLVAGGGAAALLLLVALSAWFFTKSAKPAAPAGPAPAQHNTTVAPSANAHGHGSLMVKTEPPGALVQVGDHPPVRSPFAFEDLMPGRTNVQVTLDGYEPQTLVAAIEANKLVNLGSLKLVRSSGALRILSEPTGLAYELRSAANPLEPTRGVTPMFASELPTGDYEIALFRDGWPTQRKTVSVVGREEQLAKFTFASGSVSLASEPAGATVLVNGVSVGTTPMQVEGLLPGAIKCTLTLAGYESATVEGTVGSGQTFQPALVVLKKSATVAKAKAPVSSSSSSNRSSSSRESSRDDDRPSNGTGHKIKEGFKRAFGF